MKTQVHIDPQTAAFEIYSRPAGTDGPWTLNSTGRLRQLPPNGNRKRADFQAEIAVSCPEVVQPPVCYAQFQQKGFDYGPAFQGIRSLRRGRYDALAEIELPPTLQDERDDYFLHPALLDACFQALVAVDDFGQNGDAPVEVYLPVSIERFCIYACPGNRVWSHAHVVEKIGRAHV